MPVPGGVGGCVMPAEKAAIIRELGTNALLLPSLVNEALVANDRIKYCFALLQAACAQAEEGGAVHTLKTEREAAGIPDEEFDDVVAGAVLCGPGRYLIPSADRILGMIRRLVADMARPVLVADLECAAEIRDRIDVLLSDLPADIEGPITRAAVNGITSGNRAAGDSLHLVVTDLHRILNTIQGDLAEESVDGARVYLLTDVDRALVAAFMKGLNRTSPLRFDHPGLGTTATRYRDRLVIQNDIGLTDAHVLVVTVAESTVTVTYTDIHMARLAFFQSLFDGWGVVWADTVSRRATERLEKDVYHLSVGTYRAEGIEDVWPFLTHLGSRVVFLIDWNRARKRLRAFVPNRDAVALLRWAADNEYGHVAFLALVDERLIYEALDLIGRFPMRYGEPLHQMLGPDKAVEYFRWVLRTASEGMLAGASRLVLQDEIKAELAGCFRSARDDLVAICERHAALSVEVAGLVRDSLRAVGQDDDGARVSAAAARAKDLERQADELVVQVRALSGRLETARFFDRLIETADDVVDALEEACFLLTLIEGYPVSPQVVDGLGVMADLALEQGQAFDRALTLIRSAYPAPGAREELQQFLEAVDGMVDLERECDDALRRAQATILRQSGDHRELHWALEVARHIEDSTDAAMAAAYIVRDDVLTRLRA